MATLGHFDAHRQKIMTLTDWEGFDSKNLRQHLKNQKVKPSEIDQMMKQLTSSSNEEDVRVHDSIYAADNNYPGLFNRYNDLAVPGHDSFEYARTNETEYIAELFAKAVTDPEKLYADLVEEAEDDSIFEHEQLDLMEQDYLDLMLRDGSPQAELLELQKLDIQSDWAIDAQEALDRRKEQWKTLKKDIFGTKEWYEVDIESPADEQELALYEFYEEKAEKAATPQQLEELRVEYNLRIEMGDLEVCGESEQVGVGA